MNTFFGNDQKEFVCAWHEEEKEGSHGICLDCIEDNFPDTFEKIMKICGTYKKGIKKEIMAELVGRMKLFVFLTHLLANFFSPYLVIYGLYVIFSWPIENLIVISTIYFLVNLYCYSLVEMETKKERKNDIKVAKQIALEDYTEDRIIDLELKIEDLQEENDVIKAQLDYQKQTKLFNVETEGKNDPD